MLRYLFYIVDVFAQEKYQGNQLAVIQNAEGLSDETMQKIAREINFSETAFLMSHEPREGGYDVRIFTPETELPFAGHPVLGTAHVIQHLINHDPQGLVQLNLQAGPVTVDFDQDHGDPKVLWMRTALPKFGNTLPRRHAARILGLNPEDIDERFPVQIMTAGSPFILVPLRTLDAADRARENSDEYARLGLGHNGPVFLFCPEPLEPEHHLHARMFASCYGIPEDPATGSANICLAAYLVQHRYFGHARIDIQVEQGYAIHRRSLIYLRAEERAGEQIEVQIGGKVFLIAKGELL